MAHLAIHQSRSKQIFARSEKTPLYAGILTYEYQQSVGKIPRGEPICGCDVDGYRPDTLEGWNWPASFSALWEPARGTCSS